MSSTALSFWKVKARLGLRKALGGLDYQRCVEFPYVAQQLDVHPGERVVDIGSAHLVFPAFLAAECGAKVWAIDLSPRVAQQAAYARRLGLCRYCAAGFLHAEVHDATRLGYKRETFDKVSCISTIEHIRNDTKAMQEIGRILKPGGIAVCTVPFGSRHQEIFVDEDIYVHKYSGKPVFYQYVYDESSLYSRLVLPSGMALESKQVFAETAIPLSRLVYHQHIGRFLIFLRALYPVLAQYFLRPVDRLDGCSGAAVCGFVLRKAAG